MKKLLIILAAAIGLAVHADTWTTNNVTYTYTVSDGEASIYKGSGSAAISTDESVIEIPATLGEAQYPVTSIGVDAFSCSTWLTSVTIPDSVTSIGETAFFQCTGLTSVTIPDSVRSIGDHAFHGCTGLKSVTIPDSVTSIGNLAFVDCGNLTNVTMRGDAPGMGGAGVFNNIGEGAVVHLPWQASGYAVEDGKWEGMAVEWYGPTFTIDGNGILTGVNLYETTEFVVPDGVTSIGDEAFYNCINLTSVTIPDGVTSIGGLAFYKCSGLTSVTIGISVTNIGDFAFVDCGNLTNVTMGGNAPSVGDNAFDGINSAAVVRLPRQAGYEVEDGKWQGMTVEWYGPTFTIDGSGVLTSVNLYETTEFVVPNGVTSIGDYAFYKCSGMTNVTIPSSVTSIGNYAFEFCSGLTSVTIPNSVTSIGAFAFYKCSGLTSVTIPEGVMSMGDYAFMDCSGLTSVTIPNSVTSMGDYAFYRCTGLTSVTIDNGVTDIGHGAFYKCSGLTSVTIPDSVTSIGVEAFGFTSLTSVTIPDGVTSIGYGAFSTCTSLTSVTIPDSVTSIGVEAFLHCTSLTSVTIPGSVSSIGDQAFKDCSGLTSVTMKGNAPSVGSQAFDNIGEGAVVRLPRQAGYEVEDGKWQGMTVEWYGPEFTIDGSGVLTSVNLYETTEFVVPGGVRSIAEKVFWGCSDLTAVTIPGSVTNIGKAAFLSCGGLTNVTMKGNAPSVGSWAFDYIGEGAVVHLPRQAGYEVEDGKWQGMTVEWYDPLSSSVKIDEEKMEAPVVDAETGVRTIAAKEGTTLVESDVESVSIASPLDSSVDITGAYAKVLDTWNNQIVVTLATPEFEEVEEEEKVEDDAIGFLVDISEMSEVAKAESVAAMPTPDTTSDPENPEEVAAISVKMYPGLWYQAEWGSDLHNLTPGEKFQADGLKTCIGVIKQTGPRGFYRIRVSETE